MLGGELSPRAQADEAKFIYVLNIYVLSFCPFLWTFETLCTSISRKPTPTQSSGVRRLHIGAAYGASPFQKATPKEVDLTADYL